LVEQTRRLSIITLLLVMVGIMNKVFTSLITSSYGTSKEEVQLAGMAKLLPTTAPSEV
jgi:hypothetical protein